MIILQKLLLWDAGHYEYLSCQMIKKSKSVATLTPNEQDILIEFLINGIENRKYEAAEQMTADLDRIIRMIRNQGIDEVIIRKNADAKRNDIAKRIAMIQEARFMVLLGSRSL